MFGAEGKDAAPENIGITLVAVQAYISYREVYTDFSDVLRSELYLYRGTALN